MYCGIYNLAGDRRVVKYSCLKIKNLTDTHILLSDHNLNRIVIALLLQLK